MSTFIHDGFVAFAALSFGTAIHHGLAWLRRRDLKANLCFAGVAFAMSLYAGSHRIKIDCPDLETWMKHSRFEFVLVFLLIPLFVETLAQATRSGSFRHRALFLLPLPALLAWHLVSPWGFSFSSVKGMVQIVQPWGEAIWWVDAETNFLYQGLLLYVVGWCFWFLRCALKWAKMGSALSGWGLFAAMAILLASVLVESILQFVVGTAHYPLVESSMLLLVGATSLLLSDEVLRIALLQEELQRAREELERFGREMEHRVEKRTDALGEALAEIDRRSREFEQSIRTPIQEIVTASVDMREHGSAAGGTIHAERRETIRGAIRRVGLLADGFLAHVHLRSATPRPVELDLSGLVREVAGELCQRHPEQDVRVEIQPSLFAFADAVLVRALFLRILAGFWDAARSTSLARMEIVRDGAWVVARAARAEPDAAGKVHPPLRFDPDPDTIDLVQDIAVRMGGVVAFEREGDATAIRIRVPGLSHEPC